MGEVLECPKRHGPAMVITVLWALPSSVSNPEMATGVYLCSDPPRLFFSETNLGTRAIAYMICMGCLYGGYEEDNYFWRFLHLATAFWVTLQRDTMFGSTVPMLRTTYTHRCAWFPASFLFHFVIIRGTSPLEHTISAFLSRQHWKIPCDKSLRNSKAEDTPLRERIWSCIAHTSIYHHRRVYIYIYIFFEFESLA
ncbi:hypothetical protein F4811DRAFT_538361 [Daldinia bambusicola]|nr:hypothetical protein F4811DRAFT_538361 [Daldinia bambusicola]